jgi:heptosyltransferase-2
MDLAPRSIFKEFGCEIDLLCTEKIGEVFKNDTWFRHVYSEPQRAARNDYAFVIIQSVHHRSLKNKVKYFKDLPWVCVQGYYDVPDFARAAFGAQRMSDLWSRGQDRLASNLSAHAKQKIFYVPSALHRHQFNVTIVLGGMNDVRTYNRWSEVFMHAQLPETTQITLVGTGPVAQLHAIELTTRFSELLLHDRVNQTGMNEVKSILTKTDLLVCADGGLMHMGAACDVPSIVALFIRDIPPEYRLPKQYHGGAITSDTLRVQDIPPEAIGNKINHECGRLLATVI